MATTKRKEPAGDPAAAVRRKLKREAVRVNDKSDPAGFIPYASDKANIQVRGTTVYRARKRSTNEALPVTFNWHTTYRVGDGDVLQMQRPNSDHSALKSFGTQT